MQVSFRNNRGSTTIFNTGATFFDLVNVAASDLTFINNTAGSGQFVAAASCMLVSASQVNIAGSFCAYNNVVEPGAGGGACVVVGAGKGAASLRFKNPNTANMANNSPYDIQVAGGEFTAASVRCGSTSLSSWRAGSS